MDVNIVYGLKTYPKITGACSNMVGRNILVALWSCQNMKKISCKILHMLPRALGEAGVSYYNFAFLVI